MDHKAHGLHNKSFVDFVSTTDDFPDWVITGCYYTCIHLLKHELFPNTYPTIDDSSKKKTFQSFEEYVRHVQDFKEYVNKHRLILELVDIECPNLYDEFKELKDLCWTARYQRYSMNKNDVKIAKDVLDAIYAECSTTHP